MRTFCAWLGTHLVITVFLSLHNRHREGRNCHLNCSFIKSSFSNHNVKLTRLLQLLRLSALRESIFRPRYRCMSSLSTPRMAVSTPTPERTASSRRACRIVVCAQTVVAGTVTIWNRSSTPGGAVAAPVVWRTASSRRTCRIVLNAEGVVTAAVRSNSRTRPTPRCAVTTPVFC